MKWLAVAVAVLAAGYLLVCAVFYLVQRQFIYHPTGRSASTELLALQQGDVQVLVSAGGGRHGRAILYFGGNAEDVSLTVAPLVQALPGTTVYAMHYRGNGGSGGSPSERALVADAQALFDHVGRSHGRISVIGRSLGSGIAVQLAAARPIERLALVTPYHSIAELAVAQFPFVPVRWLLRDRYESWCVATALRLPTLILVAAQDRVIPNDSSGKLAGSFPEPVTWVRIDPAGHNDVLDGPGAMDALRRHLLDAE